MRPRGGAAPRATRSHHPSASGDIPRPFFSPLQPFDLSSVIGAGSRRDSDLSSLGSSRPSSSAVSSRPSPAGDSASHLRSVNSYLSSLSPPLHLKPPFPSARDLSESLRRIFSRLHFPTPLSDLTRDLPPLLSALRCPLKLSRSHLKAPCTPHAWPSVLSVLHWLVQLALVADHIASSPTPNTSDADINTYITQSYSLFLAGDDVGVANLEAKYLEKIQCNAALEAKEVESLEAQIAHYEEKLRDAAAKPSRIEALEAERAVLLEDASKFENAVDKFSGLVEEKREKLVERERELKKREMEKRMLDEENKELGERIRGQSVSVRDVERMERELQIVEKEIAEREGRRNEVEEKTLLLGSEVERKFSELENLAERSNHAIRK